MSRLNCVDSRPAAASLSECFLLPVEYTRERQEHQQTFAKEDQRVIEETEHAASRGVSVNKKTDCSWKNTKSNRFGKHRDIKIKLINQAALTSMA